MRRFLLFLLTLASFSAANAQTSSTGGAAFSFTETTHDFGKILADSTLHYSFPFTNSGDAMLIITGIEPSCHCLSVNWTRGPIMPGTKGSVDVTYAAPIDIGRFNRALLIASNAVNVDPSLLRFELRVMGEGVKELPAAPKKKKSVSRTKIRAHRR